MEYILVRQKRRTIALYIERDGKLIVKAPLKTSISYIEDFVQSKIRWINKQNDRIKSLRDFQANFDFSSRLYIFGREYKFEEIDMKLINSTPQLRRHFYINFATQKFPDFVKRISNRIGLKYKSIKLTNSRRVWGSFDRSGNMKLNWRLVCLPEALVEYVVIHELCHGKHLNHSKEFWSLVGKFCPDYKDRKRQLDMYGFLLSI